MLLVHSVLVAAQSCHVGAVSVGVPFQAHGKLFQGNASDHEVTRHEYVPFRDLVAVLRSNVRGGLGQEQICDGVASLGVRRSWAAAGG